MKQIGIVLGLIFASILPTFALEVDCTTNTLFTGNSCDVCSTDTRKALFDGTNYESVISGISFEWTNESDGYHELIYKGEQEDPKIISNLNYIQDPADDASFWEYGEKVLWTEYEGVEEFYTDPGSTLVHRKMNNSATLRIQEDTIPGDAGYVLFVSPLKYRDFDVESFEESDVQKRTYCHNIEVQGEGGTNENNEITDPNIEILPEIGAEENVIPEPETEVLPEAQTVIPEPEPMIELNAAGPKNPQPVSTPVITSYQTSTQSGPEHIILVFIAIALGGSIVYIHRKRTHV